MSFLPCRADSTNKSLLQWRASLLKLIFAHKLYSTYDRQLLSKPQLSLIHVLKLSKICWLPSTTIIPQSHIWHHNPTWPKCPPIISDQRVLLLCSIPVYAVYMGNSTCMQTWTTPLHIFVFSLTTTVHRCLLPLCVQSEMQHYKRAIYFRIWEYFFNYKSKVKPSLQTALSKEPSTPQHPLQNSSRTSNITLLKVLIHNILNKPIFTKL